MKNLKGLKTAGVVVGVATLSLLFAACQSQPASQTSQPATQTGTEQQAEATNTITIADFAFGPSTLTVKAGSTVRVVNTDTPGHSVTSDDDTSFDTGIVGSGQTAEFTAPSTPGTYGYHCVPHPMMKGTLIVE